MLRWWSLLDITTIIGIAGTGIMYGIATMTTTTGRALWSLV